VQVLMEGSEYLALNVSMDGLADPLQMEGTICVELTGDAIYEPIGPQTFQYRFVRSAQALPCNVILEADWIHPETQKPAFGLRYHAEAKEMPRDTLFDRPYDNQDDFFQLNESIMAEYKERFLPTLVLAAAPIVMEVPAGVISDAVKWMEETGFLAFFGIE